MATGSKARGIAVTALLRIQEQGGYSHIVIEEFLNGTGARSADKALIARLIYGVIERRLTLDYVLNHVSTTPVKRMHPVVREILHVGTYQLLFMDKTPDFAAVNESVELTRAMGCAGLTGFVNGVLRSVQQRGQTMLEALPLTDKGLELRYSCPRAWIRTWREAYGDDTVAGLLGALNEAPPAYIRVNTCRTTAQRFAARLTESGVPWQSVAGLPDAMRIMAPQALTALPEAQTEYYYQDIASQWACRALGAQPGERIADVCAAPGGKSMTVAQDMENTGRIDATDLYEQKCETITRRAREYGLSCIRAEQADASLLPPAERVGQYDRVICDAPCSGLGVIRRKPEIRYKTPEDFADLPTLQLQILTQAAALVRPGGVLQYSTCTLRPEENEQVAAAFLEQNPAFSPRLLPIEECFAASGLPVSHQITLFPHIHGSDGFFIAGFVKS